MARGLQRQLKAPSTQRCRNNLVQRNAFVCRRVGMEMLVQTPSVLQAQGQELWPSGVRHC